MPSAPNLTHRSLLLLTTAPTARNQYVRANASSTPCADEAACHEVASERHLHPHLKAIVGANACDAFCQWSCLPADCSSKVAPTLQAIVGANAFQHASGVHQDGMLKNKQTYEIMSPEYIGLVRGEEYGITLGKLSGKAAVMSRLKTLGYDDLTKEQSDDVFRRFKVGRETQKWDGGHICVLWLKARHCHGQQP